MAQPYVGEIRMFAGNFAPSGWMFCDGQLLSIAENETLFQLIGTTYGGDGQETFALPNLQSRIPTHQGNGFTLAQMGGTEAETLTASQIPAHSHPFLASQNGGDANSPSGDVISASPSILLYFEDAPATNLNAAAVQPNGGSQPHDNVQPFLCVNYIISLYGIFPSP